MRDGSEVEVEGQAIQISVPGFGPRCSFELEPPPHDELENKIKTKTIYRTGRCLYSIPLSLLLLPSSSGASINDFHGSESRYLYDTLDLIYIFLDTRILVDLIILDSKHWMFQRNHNRSCSIRHLHGVWNIPLRISVQFQLRPIVPHLRHRP